MNELQGTKMNYYNLSSLLLKDSNQIHNKFPWRDQEAMRVPMNMMNRAHLHQGDGILIAFFN